MLRLRPYRQEDTDIILSWIGDEKTFYRWSAGVMGYYPITKKEFGFVEKLMAFVAIEDGELVGFFTLRTPTAAIDKLRMGFVIVNPMFRGKKKGKEMVLSGLRYAFEIYKASEVSIGVFEDNEPALYCYKSVGFEECDPANVETISLMGEEWKCRYLVIKNC